MQVGRAGRFGEDGPGKRGKGEEGVGFRPSSIFLFLQILFLTETGREEKKEKPKIKLGFVFHQNYFVNLQNQDNILICFIHNSFGFNYFVLQLIN